MLYRKIIAVFVWGPHKTQNTKTHYAGRTYNWSKLSRDWRKTPTTCNSSISVCPQVSVRLKLDGFELNLILDTFTKICRCTSYSVKIRQFRALYTKTYVRLYSSAKYFAASHLLHFSGNTEQFRIVDSYM
jgi:hypothetical protein